MNLGFLSVHRLMFSDFLIRDGLLIWRKINDLKLQMYSVQF